jgi:hypothetical protein
VSRRDDTLHGGCPTRSTSWEAGPSRPVDALAGTVARPGNRARRRHPLGGLLHRSHARVQPAATPRTASRPR